MKSARFRRFSKCFSDVPDVRKRVLGSPRCLGSINEVKRTSSARRNQQGVPYEEAHHDLTSPHLAAVPIVSPRSPSVWPSCATYLPRCTTVPRLARAFFPRKTTMFACRARESRSRALEQVPSCLPTWAREARRRRQRRAQATGSASSRGLCGTSILRCVLELLKWVFSPPAFILVCIRVFSWARGDVRVAWLHAGSSWMRGKSSSDLSDHLGSLGSPGTTQATCN